MPKLSVKDAADQLGVSTIRVRQRIHEGSLVAEMVGNRWLVDLSVVPESRPRGRPVSAALIWDAIRNAETAIGLHHETGQALEAALRAAYADDRIDPDDPRAPDLIRPDGSTVMLGVGESSRRRALLRLVDVARAVGDGGEDLSATHSFLRWLSARAERRLYRAAVPDVAGLREDERVIHSGLSHPRSGMQDPQLVEGYIATEDLGAVVADYWLDPPGVDAGPNVYLHIAPGRPTEVTPLMLAADLAEHDRSRARTRAVELVTAALS